MKIFITGPMSGIKNYNREAFQNAANQITKLGHTPLNPYNPHLAETHAPWGECMLHALTLLNNADAYTTLPGAENSTGSTIEQTFARRIGLPRFNL